MKMRLIYFLTTILMGIGIIFLYTKVDQLEGINNDWSATYQLQTYSLGVEIFKLNDEIEQCQKAVESRDVLIEWYKSQPPKIETITEIKEVPIEVVKYRNIFPREFESVEQFEEWYEAQDFKPLFPSGAYQVDCNDYAGRLQRVALMQGYSISQALVLNGKYYGIRVSDMRDGHIGNLVLIDGIYYYVEPNPRKFKVIKIVERD